MLVNTPATLAPAPMESLASQTLAAVRADSGAELADLEVLAERLLAEAERTLAGVQDLVASTRSASSVGPDFDFTTMIARARFDPITFVTSLQRLRRQRTALRNAPGGTRAKAAAGRIIDRIEDWTARFAETLRDLRWSLLALPSVVEPSPAVRTPITRPKHLKALARRPGR